jgi:phosphoenolpyruvate carboxykinase (GTP)
MTTNTSLRDWIEQTAKLTQPDRIQWCNGSDIERDELVQLMLGTGDLIELNQATFPNCYLHRSDPSDVARVEHLTFICTPEKDDAGPNNLWMDPQEAHAKVDALFAGCMKGRTMYVVPYCMGPITSPYSRCGVEVTDSPYVVLNMRIMTRMGTPALHRIEQDGTFVKGLHSIGDLDPDKRFIMHFPEELSIKSIGSGYGGNALLGKKCHALRIASFQARKEGWLAEHMLVVGLENPRGEVHYVAAAFPSACGKTNLGMLIPPDTMPGWKVWTIGEDIAWIHVGTDGRLRAINPEAGFFGVVPGTSPKTNRNAYEMIHHDTIYTNVALTADNEPWWEGRTSGTPVIDWRGQPYDKATAKTPAAHPNSRFTVSAKQNPAYSHLMEHPEGVPLSAILFGGRRREVAPLVYEARDWTHGVMIGAGMASETTAAAVGQVGIVRRDSMAMKPFCGYNFADYWSHWLSFEGRVQHLPKVFHVNWFRQDKDGKFLWPGFGDNLRVLSWIIDRCEGRAQAKETPIGFLPRPEDIDLKGLALGNDTLQQLLELDPAAWHAEIDDIGKYLDSYGSRTPQQLKLRHQQVKKALG